MCEGLNLVRWNLAGTSVKFFEEKARENINGEKRSRTGAEESYLDNKAKRSPRKNLKPCHLEECVGMV